MNGNIASRLGGFLAGFEEDLMEDGCGKETLETIHMISEIYRNFADKEFGVFRREFEKGYSNAKETLQNDFDPAAADFLPTDFEQS